MGRRAAARAGLVLSLALVLTTLAPATVQHRDRPRGRAAAEPTPSVTGGMSQPRVTERLAGGNRVETAVAVARARFASAPVAVLINQDDAAAGLAATPLAAANSGPVLLTPSSALPPSVDETLTDLGVQRVILIGDSRAVSESIAERLRARMRVWRVAGEDRFSTAAQVAVLLPAQPEGQRHVVVASGVAHADGLAAGPLAIALKAPVLLTLPDRLPQATADRLALIDPDHVTVVGGTGAVSEQVRAALGAEGRAVRRIAGPSRYATAAAAADAAITAGLSGQGVWLADGAAFADALGAAAAAASQGGVLLLADGMRLGGQPPVVEWLRARQGQLARVVLLGGHAVIGPDAPAQLEALLAGKDLPRGGRVLLPGHRLIALYGHSSTAALGSLGEQPPEQAAARAQALARRYADDPANGGHEVLPTFEFIATVATAGPGPSGLYRAPTDHAVLRRSLDAVRTVQGYLVLDIQPGRSDFLTEAKRYEALLKEPDVGLALDPEWRMAADERPGQRVGSVHADEVNAVSAWLDGLVARYALPQKLLLLHQFQDQMIRERDRLRARPGLAIAVQMDGFGSRSQKLATYARTRTAPPFFNGFKLFYDEDQRMYEPHEALRLDPVPEFISYQ